MAGGPDTKKPPPPGGGEGRRVSVLEQRARCSSGADAPGDYEDSLHAGDGSTCGPDPAEEVIRPAHGAAGWHHRGVGDEPGTTTVPTDGASEAPHEGAPATFRAVPTVSLVALGFLTLSLSPIAFQGGAWFLLLLIPLALAVWVVRSRTRVDAEGLRVRRVVGTRTLPWTRVSTLRLVERGWVRAVDTDGGELVLRGVRVRDLGRVGEASGGRIRVPGPAEAAAAEEHRRELEATRMRIARLREQRPELTREEAEAADAAAPAEPRDAGEDSEGDRDTRA